MNGFEQVRAVASAERRVPGPTVSVQEAARLLGIGRTLAYRLAAAGELPVPVLRIGRVLRVPTAPLLALLGVAEVPGQGPVGGGEAGPGVASGRASSPTG